MKVKYVFKLVVYFLIVLSCLGYKEKTNKTQPIKIACIGNSITYGAGVSNREQNAYPKQLQAMLGDAYFVENFGVSGNTLLKKRRCPILGVSYIPKSFRIYTRCGIYKIRN